MPQVKKNLFPAALVEETIKLGQGKLSSSGALVVNTGKFTGRSPLDRFIVMDDTTKTLLIGEILTKPLMRNTSISCLRKH